MSRFNVTSKGKNKTVNHMGAEAFKYSAEFELVSILLTSFAQDSYYENSQEKIDRLKTVLEKVNPEFAAKAAIYARHEFGMRSISHVLSVELINYISGKPWAKKFFKEIVRRPDDMTEILAYYFSKGNKKLPSSLKKGLSKAFDKFDRYQLAKYRGVNKEVSLVDVVNLVHPIPTEKNKTALRDLVNNKLRNVDTWEAKLSEAGKSSDNEQEKENAKSDAWRSLFESGKMPYFALLRNLRNILEQAPDLLDEACEIISDEKLIRKSLVLPFRFLSAYKEIEALKDSGESIKFEKDNLNVDKVLSALEKAVRVSVDNLPELSGNTVILSDNSGSMTGGGGYSSLVSKMSRTKTSDIANLFAMLYWLKSKNTYVGLFGDRLIEPKLNRDLGVFENFKIVDKEKSRCGGATERGIFDFFENAIKEKAHIDTIIVFSDCQIGTGCNWFDHRGNRGDSFNKLFERYKSINPDFRCYSVDLTSYGNTVFNDNVFKLAGWSEKIFDIMKIMEQDKNALINTINEYIELE